MHTTLRAGHARVCSRPLMRSRVTARPASGLHGRQLEDDDGGLPRAGGGAFQRVALLAPFRGEGPCMRGQPLRWRQVPALRQQLRWRWRTMKNEGNKAAFHATSRVCAELGPALGCAPPPRRVIGNGVRQLSWPRAFFGSDSSGIMSACQWYVKGACSARGGYVYAYTSLSDSESIALLAHWRQLQLLDCRTPRGGWPGSRPSFSMRMRNLLRFILDLRCNGLFGF